MSKNTAKNFYTIKQDAAVRDDARQARAQSTRPSGKILFVRKRSENIKSGKKHTFFSLVLSRRRILRIKSIALLVRKCNFILSVCEHT